MFFFALNHATEEKKCRALALRGGGTRGSYEVGVLNAFIDNLPPEELEYDVIVGGSIGAFNAVLLSLYSPSELKGGVNELYNHYTSMTGKENYGFWGSEKTYVLDGLWNPSFVNAEKT